jgi:hypothetical protein
MYWNGQEFDAKNTDRVTKYLSQKLSKSNESLSISDVTNHEKAEVYVKLNAMKLTLNE